MTGRGIYAARRVATLKTATVPRDCNGGVSATLKRREAGYGL